MCKIICLFSSFGCKYTVIYPSTCLQQQEKGQLFSVVIDFQPIQYHFLKTNMFYWTWRFPKLSASSLMPSKFHTKIMLKLLILETKGIAATEMKREATYLLGMFFIMSVVRVSSPCNMRSISSSYCFLSA